MVVWLSLESQDWLTCLAMKHSLFASASLFGINILSMSLIYPVGLTIPPLFIPWSSLSQTHAILKNHYKINVIFDVWTNYCNMHRRIINAELDCCRRRYDLSMFVFLTWNELIFIILKTMPPCYALWYGKLLIKYNVANWY